MLDLSADIASALLANYRGFLGSCRYIQFLLLIDVPQVQADIVGRGIKKSGHLALTKPDGILIQRYFKLSLAVLANKYLDLLINHQYCLCVSISSHYYAFET